MADLENRVDKLDERVSSLERQVSETTANFNGLIRELKDFKDEIRDRDNQRAAEIMEMRQKHEADMKDMQKNFYAKMDKMDAKIDGIGNHVRNLVWISMVAIGGMVITVIYSMLKH